MAITINVNGLTLCHQGSGGVSRNTLPDVCKTPDKGIPLPYQNEAYSRDLVKGTVTVFADGGCSIANDGSQFAKSVFDEAGSMGGVASGTHLAETDWISHSFTVFFEKKPACRLTDKLFMNHRNTANLAGLKQRDLPREEQEFMDAMCTMMCECWNLHNKNTGAQPLQKGETYQDCVKKKVDEKYYQKENGKYKYPQENARIWREVPYSRKNNWDLIGSKNNPNIPTSNYIRGGSRRLDIVWLGKNGKPLKFLDMKFPGDKPSKLAVDDYKEIAKKNGRRGGEFKNLHFDRCDCNDNFPPKNPATSPVQADAMSNKKEKYFLDSVLDEYSNALENTTGLKVTGGLLVAVLFVSVASRFVFPARNFVPVP